MADELRADRMAAAARPALLEVGEATGRVERSEVLAAEAILAQLRSIVVDLLLLTGHGPDGVHRRAAPAAMRTGAGRGQS